jgi:hypothetical protein
VEDGIEAETARSSRLESDSPFAGLFVLEDDLPLVGERHGADVAGGSIRFRDVVEKLEKPRVLHRVGRLRSEEARRLDAGKPSEGIDLEPGVFRDRGKPVARW